MALLIGPIFLILALVLGLRSRPAPLPVRSLAEVRAEAEAVGLQALVSTQPPRRRQTAPPTVLLNGYRRDCQDCHRLFSAPAETPRPLRQHQGIRLDHGINGRCFNCHDTSDRNLLTRRDGSPIPYDREEELCSQCHGTTYRDWQDGMHGKTLGYWSAALGEPRRLGCTECHDPHRPAFGGFAPAPGPRTFRMGAQHGFAEADAGVLRNPLRTWSRHADDSPEDRRRP
jgi:hypothetical protein